MLKSKYALFVIAAYIILMMGFAVYWGNNFSQFIHLKGGDVEITLWFATILTYTFFTLLYFNGMQMKGWLILILPIAITGLSFFIGFVLLVTFEFDTTQRGLTLLFLILYTTFAVLAAAIEMRSKRTAI